MRRTALFAAGVLVAVAAGPVSAKPLPPLPTDPLPFTVPLHADIYIHDLVVDYTTGATTGPQVYLTGDAAALYDCVKSTTSVRVVVTCTFDAGASWARTCSRFSARAHTSYQGGSVRASVSCSDGVRKEAATTAASIHGGPDPGGEEAHHSFAQLQAGTISCGAESAYGDPGPVPEYYVRCTFPG